MMGKRLPQSFWRADAGGGWIWSSREWSVATGQTTAASLGDGWLGAVFADDHELTRAAWLDASASGSFHVEHRLWDIQAGGWRWFQSSAAPLTEGGETISGWIGASTGVHLLHSRLERQSALLTEMQHRAFNLITVVQAIGAASAEHGASGADYQRRFGRRLAALARAQTLLSLEAEDAPITLESLIQGELSLEATGHVTHEPGRVTLDGPVDFVLRPSVVQTLTLALHELVANACEHGALSQPNGRLSLQWMRLPDAPARMRLAWKETGVTHRAPPGPAGFGRELIQQAVAFKTDAAVDYAFTSDGLVCVIEGDFGASSRVAGLQEKNSA